MTYIQNLLSGPVTLLGLWIMYLAVTGQTRTGAPWEIIIGFFIGALFTFGGLCLAGCPERR